MSMLCSLACADIAVVTNLDNDIELSLEEIRLRFLGKHLNKGSAATQIKPVNLPFGHPSRSLFDRQALDKSEANIRTYWARMIFTSRARPPIEFEAEAQVLQYIQQHPKAVGYIDTKSIDDSVKVLYTFPSRQNAK